MKSKIISSFAIFSGLVALNALGFASVARAGEGGIAGAAAFTLDTSGNVLGVAVATAVGKENAAAASFNYTGGGIQNAAWSMGTAGTLGLTNIGSTTGFSANPVIEPTDRMDDAQANTFSNNTVNIKIGKTTGDDLIQSPSSP
ncbi:MAG: hypothetical protein MGF17_17990 [Trichodesmium sp. MAG_R04]|nr:hypothetical protein [Trichodesmium sp. MAG_R04]